MPIPSATPANTSVPASIQALARRWMAWLSILEIGVTHEVGELPYDIRGNGSLFAVNAAEAIPHMLTETVRLSELELGFQREAGVDREHYFERFCSSPDVLDWHRHARHIDDLGHIVRARRFDPIAVFEAIKADQTPEAIAAQNATALAESAFSLLGLGRQTMKFRAGRATLNFRAFSEPSFSGGRAYGCTTAGALEKTITALCDVLTSQGRPGYLDTANARARSFALQSRTFKPRGRLMVTPDVELVFYSEKIEILLSAEAAAALNCFLGQWLPQQAA